MEQAVPKRGARPTGTLRILTFVAILLGAWLRTAWLGEEGVLGDEIHTIKATTGTLARILTHFQMPDNCIPISAWCKLLSVSVGLDEWGLRMLSLVPGIVLLWIAVRATASLSSPQERLLLALLLAASPLLVFWSRTGRPYHAISLLGVLAVLYMLRYGQERRLRWCVACALCQFGLFLFSPTTAPALVGLNLAAAVWGFTAGAPKRAARARIASVLKMLQPAILGGLITLVSLAFALPSLFELLGTERPDTAVVNASTWVESAQLLFGFSRSLASPDRLLLVLPLALTIWGLVRFCREHHGLALPACLWLFTSPILYTLSEFKGLGHSAVFVRYQAATIPFYLFFLAHGVGGLLLLLTRLSVRLEQAGVVVAVASIAALTFAGPLRSGIGPTAPWGLMYSRLFEATPLVQTALTSHMPDFYRQLTTVEDLTLYECYIDPRIERQIAVYQALHGGRVVRSQSSKESELGLMRFENLLVGMDALRTEVSPGAYVVIHRNPLLEKRFFTSGRPRGNSAPTERSDSKLLARFAMKDGRELFGKPVYEDEYITVFGHQLEAPPTILQPERRGQSPPVNLSHDPLVFSATPTLVAPGELLHFETSAGYPGETLALIMVAKGGRRVNIELASGLVDITGVWKRAIRIPRTYPATSISFELTGTRHAAALTTDARVEINVSKR